MTRGGGCRCGECVSSGASNARRLVFHALLEDALATRLYAAGGGGGRCKRGVMGRGPRTPPRGGLPAGISVAEPPQPLSGHFSFGKMVENISPVSFGERGWWIGYLSVLPRSDRVWMPSCVWISASHDAKNKHGLLPDTKQIPSSPFSAPFSSHFLYIHFFVNRWPRSAWASAPRCGTKWRSSPRRPRTRSPRPTRWSPCPSPRRGCSLDCDWLRGPYRLLRGPYRPSSIGVLDHSPYEGCRHSRVSDWLHGPYSVSSTGVLTHAK
jgi:hypothetical protein